MSTASLANDEVASVVRVGLTVTGVGASLVFFSMVAAVWVASRLAA